MYYELDCKWHFATMKPESGDEGPNSAMSQTFDQFPCYSLVRESIQNSLDAVLDESKPVEVSFEYREFDRKDYPQFFELQKYVEGCLTKYYDNKSAKNIYPPIIDQLKNSQKIGFIRVSDYNTKGMTYALPPNDTNTTFYAFVRSAGVSVKQREGSGGSFGFGKGAFFVMSPINTLIVSTLNEDGISWFEGVTRLCTNYTDGAKRSHMGFYDNNESTPVSDNNKIPLPFRRDKKGTSIGIMGISNKEWRESIPEIIKAVLANYFGSILMGKLVVYIDCNPDSTNKPIVINKDSINNLIFDYFEGTKDKKRKGSFNPIPYYESLLNPDYFFEEKLDTIGTVKLYIKEFPENVPQIVYMRKPLMKVFRDSAGNSGNFNGVFICDNEIGNKILGDCEDPEHKSWDPELCRNDRVDTSYHTACKALKEIEEFISKKLDEILEAQKSETYQVANLEKYLPSLRSEEGKGEKGNPFYGKRTGNYTYDGKSLTTEGKITKQDKDRNSKGNIAEIKKGKLEKPGKKDDNTEVVGTGGPGGGSGGGPNVPGDDYGKKIITEGNGSYKKIVEVDWRPVQRPKPGEIDVVIYSPHQIDKAELKFEIGSESKRANKDSFKDDISISYSSKGVPKDLIIQGVTLNYPGKNIIRINLSDNLHHSLKLEVYETK